VLEQGRPRTGYLVPQVLLVKKGRESFAQSRKLCAYQRSKTFYINLRESTCIIYLPLHGPWGCDPDRSTGICVGGRV